MRLDYQATLHRIGEEIPLRIEGWTFAGSSIKEGETGPFIFARWTRRLPESQMGWLDDKSYTITDDVVEPEVLVENVQRLARFIGLDLERTPETAHKALVQLELALPTKRLT